MKSKIEPRHCKFHFNYKRDLGDSRSVYFQGHSQYFVWVEAITIFNYRMVCGTDRYFLIYTTGQSWLFSFYVWIMLFIKRKRMREMILYRKNFSYYKLIYFRKIRRWHGKTFVLRIGKNVFRQFFGDKMFNKCLVTSFCVQKLVLVTGFFFF